LLTAYFGQNPDEATWRAFDAMQGAALVRETMWAMVSDLHLAAPGADYKAYTALTDADIKELTVSLDALSEQVSKAPGVVEAK
jgi:hypothetical protein